MMSYIGKCKGCKNIVGAVVDLPDHKKDTAKAVAEFINDGLEIEQVSVDYVRENFSYRECKTDKQVPIPLSGTLEAEKQGLTT